MTYFLLRPSRCMIGAWLFGSTMWGKTGLTAYLITGNPGSGKTSLAEELARRGYAAIDADECAGWETISGMPVAQPEPVPADWVLNHRWVWNRTRIEEGIRERSLQSEDLYVCGIAINQREMLDLFDLVFLLTLDDTTQIERLDASSNAHRSEKARAQILAGRPVFEQQIREAGAITLDGRQPTSLLAERIVREVRSRP